MYGGVRERELITPFYSIITKPLFTIFRGEAHNFLSNYDRHNFSNPNLYNITYFPCITYRI